MMTKHQQIQQLIAVYADLDAAEQAKVDAHVVDCSECAARLAAYQAQDRQLAQLVQPSPRASLRADFYARLEQAEGRSRWPFRLNQMALQTAVWLLALALFVSFWLAISNQSSTTVTAPAAPTATATATAVATNPPAATSTPIPIPTIAPTAVPTPQWVLQQDQVLTDGRSRINKLALAADGQSFVTGYDNQQVQRWTNGSVEDTWTMPGLAAASLAIAPDGSRVAAGSLDYDGYVVLWPSGERYYERLLAEHGDSVTALSFAGDGRLLASGTDDGESLVRLWQTVDGTLLHTLTGSGRINVVTFSPDSTLLAAGSSDGVTWVWRTADGELVATLSEEAVGISALAFSPDGRWLIGGSQSGDVWLWEIETGELMQSLGQATAVINSLVYSGDGTQMAAADTDGTVYLWQIVDDEPMLLLAEKTAAEKAQIIQLMFVPDGLWIVTGLLDGRIEIWQAKIQ